MNSSYFDEVRAAFGTEFWINNPSGAELETARDAGAVAVASNPAYPASLLKCEPEAVRSAIDESLQSGDEGNDDERVAMRVIHKLVSRAMVVFRPRFDETGGRFGHAAIQGNPRRNDDLDTILNEAEEFRALGDNVIIKVPATPVGASAMEEMTARGWPTIATMSFAVDQYVHMAEAHRRGLRRTSAKPRCLITMLPGLFDEYLIEDAAQRGVIISPAMIQHAGLATARAAYQIYRQRQYEAIILSGGARSTAHWTELVGRGMAITLSGSLAQTLARERPPVVSRIEATTSQTVIDELRQKFPDFARACDVGALLPREFRSYGPVARFQNIFLKAFDVLIAEIRSRRAAREPAATGKGTA